MYDYLISCPTVQLWYFYGPLFNKQIVQVINNILGLYYGIITFFNHLYGWALQLRLRR